MTISETVQKAVDRPQLIQDIERACQVSNPSLLKLEMGCRILMKSYNKVYPEPYEITVYEVAPYNENLIQPMGEDIACFKHKKDIIKILGKEPGLFDIKLLLEYNDYAIEEHFLNIIKAWDSPDKLSSQSEECLNLILPYVHKQSRKSSSI